MYEQITAYGIDEIGIIASIISKNDHRYHNAAQHAGDQGTVDLIES